MCLTSDRDAVAEFGVAHPAPQKCPASPRWAAGRVGGERCQGCGRMAMERGISTGDLRGA